MAEPRRRPLEPGSLPTTMGISARCPRAVAAAGGIAAHFADAALTNELAIPATIVIGAASIWASLRVSLPVEDRASLGKVARTLRLVPAQAVG